MFDSKNGTVVIGGDSAATSDIDICQRVDRKVFKNNGFVIGGTTSFRMIQLLQYKFKPPKIDKTDLHEYMCTTFIDAIRKCFSKNGFDMKYKNGSDKGGIFLVAYQNRLFRIDEDFQVGELILPYTSAGCGERYANGALYAIEEQSFKMTTKEKVLCALRCATKLTNGVLSPYILEETDRVDTPAAKTKTRKRSNPVSTD